MSLIYTTGFDHDAYGYRISLAGGIANTGRFGRGRFARFSNGNHYADITFTPAEHHNSLVIGFACIEVAGPYLDLSFSSSMIRLFGDAGQDHISIYWTSPMAGQYALRVRRGDGTILHTSAPIRVVTGVWHYYEFRVTIDDVNGAVQYQYENVQNRPAGSSASLTPTNN